eukprot:2004464-Prymnesium_polylepis.1
MATLARLEVSDGEAKRAYVKRRLASKLAAKGNNTLLASLAHEVQVEMERCRAVEHHMQLTRLRRDSESRLPWGLHLMRANLATQTTQKAPVQGADALCCCRPPTRISTRLTLFVAPPPPGRTRRLHLARRVGQVRRRACAPAAAWPRG